MKDDTPSIISGSEIKHLVKWFRKYSADSNKSVIVCTHDQINTLYIAAKSTLTLLPSGLHTITIKTVLALCNVAERYLSDAAATNEIPKCIESVLNDEAQDERDDFEASFDGGCTCHLGHPPCSWCTHPGNPLGQEDEDCWINIQWRW